MANMPTTRTACILVSCSRRGGCDPFNTRRRSFFKLWQLIVALAKSLQAHRKADAFFRRLKDDEGRSLTGAQLLDQVVVHHHFGHATVRQAAHETGPPDVRIVDFQPETRG